MPFIIYDPTTGKIQSTGSLALDPINKPLDATSLQKISANGLIYMEVDDFVGADIYQVDLTTQKLILLPPPPPAPPDLMAQLIGALINKGVLAANDFHADTIIAINVELARGSMNQIK